jgi:ribosomal protein S6
MLDEHSPLKEHLDVRARHAETDTAFDRAGCRFVELAERMGNDELAYQVAGVELADHRMLAAFKAMHEARVRLVQYTRTLPIVQRIMVIGAAMCTDLPEAAND